MDLVLTFANHTLSGDGRDDIGLFFVAGRFDQTRGECYWTKTYIGAHHVFYRGFREGKGIWGTWEIGADGRGGFHIWPLKLGQNEQASTATEQQEPVKAIGKLLTAGKL